MNVSNIYLNCNKNVTFFENKKLSHTEFLYYYCFFTISVILIKILLKHSLLSNFINKANFSKQKYIPSF